MSSERTAAFLILCAAPCGAQTVEQIAVTAASPLLGAGANPDQVPGQTQSLSAADIARRGTPDLLGALAIDVGGVDLSAASGNPDQPSLFYHGFEASPLQGTAQGLAVYVDGVRFNQPFGDTIDWDLIPPVAIDRVDIEGANPVYGLNALGGAIDLRLKDGFGAPTTRWSLSGGSFGRVEADGEVSRRAGDDALYVAARVLHEEGWRDLQSSDIQNLYADLGRRSDAGDVHLRLNLANSVLNGPGTSPVELLAADPAAQFTSPNIVANRSIGATLDATHAVGETLSLHGDAYYSYLLQRVVNGNTANDLPCDDGSGLLCSAPGQPSLTRGGGTIGTFSADGEYAQLDDQTTNTNGFGGALQLTLRAPLWHFANRLTLGASVDASATEFSATAYQGGLSLLSRAFLGPGVVIDEPGIDVPVRVAIANETEGLYVTDTLSLTRQMSLTASGRLNLAEIDLADQGGGTLSGHHAYNSFAPAIGATWAIAPAATLYAGYASTSRAPTPAELSCAGPQDSCSLANFFAGDPDLKQVIAHTVEAGVRGRLPPRAGIALRYDLSLYRTDSDDDIAFINSITSGRAFFANVGQTRRQGIDASVQADWRRVTLHLAWSLVDATFQHGFVEAAGSNPAADANGNVVVRSGDRLPSVPAQRFKADLRWRATDALTLEADLVAQSGQYLVGDPGNATPRLDGFTTVDVVATWEIRPGLSLFARSENLGDARYGTFGTFSPTSAIYLRQAPGASNPRATSLAAPRAIYAGLRLSY